MPYIAKKDRKRLEKITEFPATAGELNYLLTTMIAQYTKRKGLSYQTINDVVGALEGAKLEYYRRIAGPYEEKKVKENGDVY